jgi:rhodanese-related sulfurtransferase
MAPFDVAHLAAALTALVFVAIGFGFGAVLELTGFGDTRKLAAQFYLRDLTVLKTMFTAIVTAAVLTFLASSLGLLDMSRVWVNPTYLWPGIVGGLVMGVGFVVGGFCPGTSLVAASTLKIDGMLFVAGGLTGAWLFGESVSSFEDFFVSSYMGRFTLPDWLGLSTGATIVLVVLFALAAFVFAEWVESKRAPLLRPSPWQRLLRYGGAAALLVGAVVVAARGQPSAEQRFRASPALEKLARDGAMLVHPAEVVALRQDLNLEVQVVDVRSEHDFNLFHLAGARRVDPAALEAPENLRPLLDRGTSSVLFVVANDDADAVKAWRRLTGAGVQNAYVVEGGVNRWLDLYPAPACVASRLEGAPAGALRWTLAWATGESLPSAAPDLAGTHGLQVPCGEQAGSHSGSHEAAAWPVYAFTKKVKLQSKAAVKGGCG